MSIKTKLYCAHRWIGLAVSLQLLAWSTGGFIFSVLDIEDVRGSLDAPASSHSAIMMTDVAATPAQAMAATIGTGARSEEIVGVELRQRLDGPIYVVTIAYQKRPAVVDARTGRLALPMSEDQAKAAALADFIHPAQIETVELLKGDPPGEYRGGTMPVYRVVLDHPKRPHLYVSPATGQVLKRRNKLWRIFDFFWMLHIMDYRGRENFNHRLLTGMSGLAIASSLSGLALWWWRIPRRRRPRRSR